MKPLVNSESVERGATSHSGGAPTRRVSQGASQRVAVAAVDATRRPAALAALGAGMAGPAGRSRAAYATLVAPDAPPNGGGAAEGAAEASVAGWWIAQLAFFFSGLYVTLNQYETNWGANKAKAMLNALAQYGGMAVGGYAIIHALRRARRPTGLWPLPLLADRRTRRAVLAMALPDLAAAPFQVYGLNVTGSGVFIVVFATVTLWVAALRYCALGRGLRALQVAGLCMIVGGQCLVVQDGAGAGRRDAVAFRFVLGVLSILVAAFLDAVRPAGVARLFFFSGRGATAPCDR